MFTKDMPLYVQKIYPAVETVDQEERRILVLEFLIQPFTSAMAQELGILGHLFTRKDGGPIEDLANLTVNVKLPLQVVGLAAAPDAPLSVTLRSVEIDPALRVRRDKEGPVFAATLIVSVRYPDPSDLLYLMNSYRRQVFATFENEQADLLTEASDPPKPSKKKTRTVVVESDTP